MLSLSLLPSVACSFLGNDYSCVYSLKGKRLVDHVLQQRDEDSDRLEVKVRSPFVQSELPCVRIASKLNAARCEHVDEKRRLTSKPYAFTSRLVSF